MARGVPDEDRVSPFKMLDLFVEQPVIRRQPRQKDQLWAGLCRVFVDPIVYLPAGSCVGSFLHAVVTSAPSPW